MLTFPTISYIYILVVPGDFRLIITFVIYIYIINLVTVHIFISYIVNMKHLFELKEYLYDTSSYVIYFYNFKLILPTHISFMYVNYISIIYVPKSNT